MNKTKQEIARIQLERAIDLFFEGQDYISTITLAGASEEITRQILERQGKPTSSEKLKEWVVENHPDSPALNNFYVHANKTRNSLKHFTDPEELEVFVDQAEAQYWVTRALLNYEWSNLILTEPMVKLMFWLKSQSA